MDAVGVVTWALYEQEAHAVESRGICEQLCSVSFAEGFYDGVGCKNLLHRLKGLVMFW